MHIKTYHFLHQGLFPIAKGSLTSNKNLQHRHYRNTHAGTHWNQLYRCRVGHVNFSPVTLPSTNGGLTQSVISSAPPKLLVATLTATLECTISLYRTKTMRLHTSNIHASLSSNDLAFYAILDYVQSPRGRRAYSLLPSTSDWYTLLGIHSSYAIHVRTSSPSGHLAISIFRGRTLGRTDFLQQ